MEKKVIAPSLLLPIIEESLKQSNGDVEQPWININISLEEDLFMMKLGSGIPGGEYAQRITGDALDNVKNRLTLMYPHMHELKVSTEPEMLIVLLKIHLMEADQKHFIANAVA
jgi:two-component system, LytTR family, sensor kinase